MGARYDTILFFGTAMACARWWYVFSVVSPGDDAVVSCDSILFVGRRRYAVCVCDSDSKGRVVLVPEPTDAVHSVGRLWKPGIGPLERRRERCVPSPGVLD
ncbi:hypothetical protein PLESTM_000016500 [Pleodorina starrii]|nr:hypothetical protein PLESTM_000016500 [Pleodorina starrii]